MPMKLTYFNVRGLAETTRYLLALGGEEYEDFRYPLEVIDMSKYEMNKEEFDKDKADGKLVTSLNKVPFLEVDGVTIPQSKAMERFLARRYNMMGSTEIECAQIDAICESVRDFKDMYQKVRSLPVDEKEAGMKEWFTVTLVERLTLLEHQLVGDSGFSVGNTTSLSDVVLFTFVTEFFDNKEASLNATLASPKVRAVVDRLSSDEKVLKWISERPKTSF
jgi:prostaglandin-H2 D-isomerase / glutathione transferase